MIPLFKVYMAPSVLQELQRTLYSGHIGEGPQVSAFEEEFAAWLDVPRAVAVNSGTSAIELALRLSGVGPGDEVVTTPMTCVATNMPILALGGTPVWADVNPLTGNISPRDAARKCSSRTKAIVAVHWGGNPCDLIALNGIATARGIPLIEDAAHALGSRYRSRNIGGHSKFVCFSFQAIKTLTTGDGGALICQDPADDARARRLRWFGLDRKLQVSGQSRWEQDIPEYGYKFHMNDIAATIGREQLRYIADNLAKCRSNARVLDAALKGFRWLRHCPRQAQSTGSHWLYTVLSPHRDAFADHMQRAGIETSRVHIRNDRYQAFATSPQVSLPGVDTFESMQVSIPCGWWLTMDELDHIAGALSAFEAKACSAESASF